MRAIQLVLTSLLVASTPGCDRCSRAAPTPDAAPEVDTSSKLVVGRVTTSLTAYDQDGADLDLQLALDTVLRGELAKAETLLLREDPDQPALRATSGSWLKLSAKLAVDGFTKELHALVDVKLTRTGSIPVETSVDTVLRRPAKGEVFTREDYDAHLKSTVAQVVADLDAAAMSLTSGSTSLVAALESERSAVKVAAIQELGRRQAREAVAPLCKALQREQLLVARTVILALAAIDSEEATPCMIEWAGSDDSKIVLVIGPLTDIGGREAQAFLESLAAGHPDDRIKSVAEAGVRRLKGLPPLPPESDDGDD